MRSLLVFLLFCGCCPKQDITNNTIASVNACTELCRNNRYAIYATNTEGNLTSCECRN